MYNWTIEYIFNITYKYIYGLSININVFTYTSIWCITIHIQLEDAFISKIKSYLIFSFAFNFLVIIYIRHFDVMKYLISL